MRWLKERLENEFTFIRICSILSAQAEYIKINLLIQMKEERLTLGIWKSEDMLLIGQQMNLRTFI